MGVLMSEWLKLRSVRSTAYALGAASAGVLLGAAVAWYAAGAWDAASPAMRPHVLLSPIAPLAGWLAQLALAVLGILSVTAEHATGTISASLAAVPRRLRLLAARAAVVGAVALAAGQGVVFATYLVCHWIIGGRPMQFWTAPASAEVPVLASWGVSVMVFGLVGLGLGAMLRSTAAAIVAVAALWYVLPLVAPHLPSPWGRWVSAGMLINLAPQLSGAPALSAAHDALLSPPAALGVMAAYVALALGGAAIVLCRRDS